MRAFCAIAAAVVWALLMPTASRADAPGPAAASAAAPDCKCPRVHRPHRVVRRHVRHHRHRRAVAALPYPPPLLAPAYYNTGIPSPYDTAYDRAMTLHFRTVFVSGMFDPEPGYPHTPPVRAVQPYRYRAGDTVYQYDGLIGEYVALAQYDGVRALPPPPLPPSAAAPPPAQ